ARRRRLICSQCGSRNVDMAVTGTRRRVYREAIDHDLDFAIVERAAIARKEVVDRCTIFEFASAHPPPPLVSFPLAGYVVSLLPLVWPLPVAGHRPGPRAGPPLSPRPLREPGTASPSFSLEDTSPPWSADAARPECGHCWRRPRDSEPPAHGAHPGPTF